MHLWNLVFLAICSVAVLAYPLNVRPLTKAATGIRAPSTNIASINEIYLTPTTKNSRIVGDAIKSGPRYPNTFPNHLAAIVSRSNSSNSSISIGDVGIQDANVLPIQPQITPALSIAGVVLMTIGMFYNMVGIRNQWLHVFTSAAFLTSLSVTVLIVYVMDPPVQNAIQGAYFVAAFLTGVVFGALAMVFKELTEGLGCILGGYCLSMWILALKPGGLLTGVGSKSGFIAALSAVSYAFSFTPYTRPYALMGSTALSGATATVIGIDCFSRAGLKEFWLYIWALNGNIFPLDIYTYPVTRGIRVELAVIMLLCFVGILSQFKLWNIINERRKKRAVLEEEERKIKDAAEIETGRRVKEEVMREMVRWEAAYQPDPLGNVNVDDSQKCLAIDKVVEATGGRQPIGGQDVHTPQQITKDEEDSSTDIESQADVHKAKLSEPNKQDMIDRFQKPQDERLHEPKATEDISRGGQDASNTQFREDIAPASIEPPVSAHVVPPDWNSFSYKMLGIDTLAVENADNDSVEATIDDTEHISTQSLRRLSSQSAQTWLSQNRTSGALSPDQRDVCVQTDELCSRDSHIIEYADGDAVSKSDKRSLTEPNCGDPLPTSPSECHPNEIPLPPSPTTQRDSSRNSSQSSTRERSELTSGAVERLPNHLSRIVMSYRTNEWAKHSAEADTPDLEPVEDDSGEPTTQCRVASPTEVQESHGATSTAPSVVDSQVSSIREPDGVRRQSFSDVSRYSIDVPLEYPTNLDRPTQPQQSSPRLSPTSTASKSSSALSISTRTAAQHLGVLREGRNSSLHPQAPLTSATIHESKVANFRSSPKESPSLLAQRENMAQNRISSLSLNRDPRVARSYSRQSLDEAQLQPHINRPISPQPRYSLPLQGLPSSNPRGIPKVMIDSTAPNHHASQATNGARTTSAMAAWRESIREDRARSHSPLTDMNVARYGMIEQQRRSRLVEHRQVMASQQMQNLIAVRMQRGEMRDLHREAIRRMQATANEHISRN